MHFFIRKPRSSNEDGEQERAAGKRKRTLFHYFTRKANNKQEESDESEPLPPADAGNDNTKHGGKLTWLPWKKPPSPKALNDSTPPAVHPALSSPSPSAALQPSQYLLHQNLITYTRSFPNAVVSDPYARTKLALGRIDTQSASFKSSPAPSTAQPTRQTLNRTNKQEFPSFATPVINYALLPNFQEVTRDRPARIPTGPRYLAVQRRVTSHQTRASRAVANSPNTEPTYSENESYRSTIDGPAASFIDVTSLHQTSHPGDPAEWRKGTDVPKPTRTTPRRNSVVSSFTKAIVLDTNESELPYHQASPTCDGATNLLHPSWSPSIDRDYNRSSVTSSSPRTPSSSNLQTSSFHSSRPSILTLSSEGDLSTSIHHTPTTPATTIREEEPRRFKSLPPSPSHPNSEFHPERLDEGAGRRSAMCWMPIALAFTPPVAVSRLAAMAPTCVSAGEVEGCASGLEGMISRMRPCLDHESDEGSKADKSDDVEGWWGHRLFLESGGGEDEDDREKQRVAGATDISSEDIVVAPSIDKPLPATPDVSVQLKLAPTPRPTTSVPKPDPTIGKLVKGRSF
ncbi:hypothetical protein FRB98_007524 [Tulasnella sp. 332]|nr:hypothetical protein FRB98_007524 [Tulasnella sp. 332]